MGKYLDRLIFNYFSVITLVASGCASQEKILDIGPDKEYIFMRYIVNDNKKYLDKEINYCTFLEKNDIMIINGIKFSGISSSDTIKSNVIIGFTKIKKIGMNRVAKSIIFFVTDSTGKRFWDNAQKYIFRIQDGIYFPEKDNFKIN